MPNGRSGGFIIETADFQRFVQAISNDAVVGGAVVGDLTTDPRPQAARAVEVARYIKACPHDRVAVEEQDHAAYIIHLSNDEANIMWIMVGSQSPMFLDLRRRHDQWMAEHPGWDGWIG